MKEKMVDKDEEDKKKTKQTSPSHIERRKRKPLERIKKRR